MLHNLTSPFRFHAVQIFCLSFHLRQKGFFPGTGANVSIGEGDGKYTNLNIPLRGGIEDEAYVSLFKKVVSSCAKEYRPHAIVMQCGCDCLYGDPIARDGLSLSDKAVVTCVKHTLEVSSILKCPVLILGGGGYDPVNTARVWTQITTAAAGVSLRSDDVPSRCSMFKRFGPSYTVSMPPLLRTSKDLNSAAYINAILDFVRSFLQKLRARVRQGDFG